MSERHFNDEEVAAIFKRASENEHQGLPPLAEGKGMTLAMLQDIGLEAGMSPESIADAARALAVSTTTTSETFLGLPIGVGQAVEIDHPMSDADWERLVGDLRVTFNAQGLVQSDGRLRQWRNGNLRAVVEPTANGQRIRIQTFKADSRAMMILGSVAMGAAVAVSAAVVAAGNTLGNAIAGIAFMGLMGAGSFAFGALRLPGWARRRRAQIAEVTSRAAASDKPRIAE
jgi:hypothetical protein